MKLGNVDTYRVERETNLGYMIMNEDGLFFLHHNECDGKYFKEGDMVEAFLYMDKKRRVAATCLKPFITIAKGGFCEVVEVGSAGVFVNIGINRDILLSSDQLEEGKWPQIGDKLCCTLRTRGENLFIRLLNKEDIIKLSDDSVYPLNTQYIGYVYRITEHGINVVTEQFKIVFVYFKNLRKKYRIGEKVEVLITHKNETDYYGSIVEGKIQSIEEDSKIILAYLEKNYGVMPYTSQTPPDMIMRVFKMSKLAFKRALGHLYKENKVLLEDKKTIMVDYK